MGGIYQVRRFYFAFIIELECFKRVFYRLFQREFFNISLLFESFLSRYVAFNANQIFVYFFDIFFCLIVLIFLLIVCLFFLRNVTVFEIVVRGVIF